MIPPVVSCFSGFPRDLLHTACFTKVYHTLPICTSVSGPKFLFSVEAIQCVYDEVQQRQGLLKKS